MVTKCKQGQVFFSFPVLLIALTLVLVSCGASTANTPTASAPTSKPQPTFTVKVDTETETVVVGQEVAIVASVAPLEKLTLSWSVSDSSTAEGDLNTETGPQVVFTPSKPGKAFIIARGTTESGVPVEQTVTLTVVDKPTEVPVEPASPTIAPSQPTAPPQPTAGSAPTEPAATASSASAANPVTLTSHQDGQSYACQTTARGTYLKEAIKGHIWVLVYIDGKYWPQDEGGSAPPMRPDGTWFSTVRIGGCDTDRDVGKTFQLFVVEADDAAHQVFIDWLTHGKETGEFPGIPEADLPKGIKKHIEPIFVTRK